jgi:hypothetical protein
MAAAAHPCLLYFNLILYFDVCMSKKIDINAITWTKRFGTLFAWNGGHIYRAVMLCVSCVVLTSWGRSSWYQLRSSRWPRNEKSETADPIKCKRYVIQSRQVAPRCLVAVGLHSLSKFGFYYFAPHSILMIVYWRHAYCFLFLQIRHLDKYRNYFYSYPVKYALVSGGFRKI